MSDPSLEDLVARFLELREAGDNITAAEFARDHPNHSDLLDALERAQQTESMLHDPEGSIKRLGPYKLIEQIGSGGMGRVYRAVHEERPDEEVALKILSQLALGDDKARARFDRECRALTQLDDKGIVEVLDYGEHEGMPFLAMEFVRGPNLRELIDQARSDHERDATKTPSDCLALRGPGSGCHRAAALVGKLARAVAVAHGSAVLHRDIKPSNVFLRPDDAPVLGDFGLARRAATIDLTASGELLGTPLYMAPEQARGAETDERTDVHALGLLLYEMVTLAPPRPGSDPMSLLRAVAERPAPLSFPRDPDIPKPLENIIRRACAFRPAARYATVAELADDLEAFAADQPIQARSAGIRERLHDAWEIRPQWVLGSAALLLAAMSLPVLSYALREPPPNVQLFIDRACLALEADDLPGVATAAERILAADPDHPTGLFLARAAHDDYPADSSDPAIKMLIRGRANHRDKIWEEAIDDYQAASELDPQSRLPQIYLAKLRLERPQQLEQSERRLARNPEDAEAWYRKGRVEQESRNYQEAIASLTRATELDPNLSAAWRHLALAQHSLHRDAEALRSLQHAGPSEAVTYARTVVMRDKADAPHARRALEAVLANEPERPRALVTMGMTYDYECDVASAATWYERALEQDPDDRECLYLLAWLHAGGDRACEECRKFHDENPGYLDNDKVERHLLRLVATDLGRSQTMRAVELARDIQRTEKMQALLERLLAPTNDETLSPKQRNNLAEALDDLRR